MIDEVYIDEGGCTTHIKYDKKQLIALITDNAGEGFELSLKIPTNMTVAAVENFIEVCLGILNQVKDLKQ